MKQCLSIKMLTTVQLQPVQKRRITTAYNNALKEAERIAPNTREDRVAEFGEGQCRRHQPKALAWHQKTGAGPAIQREFLDADGRLHVMGRLMGGGGTVQQPLFSPENPASPGLR